MTDIEMNAAVPGIEEMDRKTEARWYVVHTYSGHEAKVKMNILKMAENRGMTEQILDIVVPTEKVEEQKNGQRKIKERKMFPGYIVIKMVHNPETWFLVRNTQGVTGFISDHDSNPIPLTDEEVGRMGLEKVYIKLDIEVGERITVISGPFERMEGVVEEISFEKQVVTAKLLVFGRDTSVELEFGQVEKIG